MERYQAKITGMWYIRIYFCLCKTFRETVKVRIFSTKTDHQGKTSLLGIRGKHLDITGESDINLHHGLPFYLKHIISVPKEQ